MPLKMRSISAISAISDPRFRFAMLRAGTVTVGLGDFSSLMAF
jgi:hypothetical protein